MDSKARSTVLVQEHWGANTNLVVRAIKEAAMERMERVLVATTTPIAIVADGVVATGTKYRSWLMKENTRSADVVTVSGSLCVISERRVDTAHLLCLLIIKLFLFSCVK